MTATVRDQRGDLLPGASVAFSVTGAHTVSGTVATGADGTARFCWTGTAVGDDAITASAGQASDTAAKTWVLEPARAATLVLAPKTATNFVGAEHCVTATVRDQRGNLFPGAPVAFAVTGAHTAAGTVATGADGTARFCWTGTSVGDDAITACAG